MTEYKRFVSYFDKDNNYIIQDLTEEDEYQVGFVHCDEDLILNLMNELNDENKQLKKEYRQLQIDFNSSCGMVHDLKEIVLDLVDEQEENKELKSDRDYWKTLAQSLAKKNGKGDFE